MNISDDGAALEVNNPSFVVPSRFQMMTESDRQIRDCRIVWIKLNRIGVELL
jgi:hypothetical protein